MFANIFQHFLRGGVGAPKFYYLCEKKHSKKHLIQMRRMIIAALALVAGVVWSHNAQAQILGDSLVQVIAYWSKDLVLHYRVVETEVVRN